MNLQAEDSATLSEIVTVGLHIMVLWRDEFNHLTGFVKEALDVKVR